MLWEAALPPARLSGLRRAVKPKGSSEFRTALSSLPISWMNCVSAGMDRSGSERRRVRSRRKLSSSSAAFFLVSTRTRKKSGTPRPGKLFSAATSSQYRVLGAFCPLL